MRDERNGAGPKENGTARTISAKTLGIRAQATLLKDRPALQGLTTLTNSTRVKRKELLSPFNFAAFYLPYVLRAARRVIYLDTDVVVTGDVGELAALDLGGAPAAAVEDCTQPIEKYVNVELLETLGPRARARSTLREDGAGSPTNATNQPERVLSSP